VLCFFLNGQQRVVTSTSLLVSVSVSTLSLSWRSIFQKNNLKTQNTACKSSTKKLKIKKQQSGGAAA
jgi:hypothetical protein